MKTSIFVYGTLQSRQGNSHYCRNAINIEKATVCGKLYQLSAGYPTLQVPTQNIILAGIEDAFKSAQEQCRENKNKTFGFKIHDDWDLVHGELVTFSDPAEIQPIDRLEGTPFYYDRVLVPAQKVEGKIIAAWVYIMYEIPRSSSYLPNGIWPENNQSGENNVRR